MGCFFGCFGIKDSPSHVDHQLSRNQLASAFFCSSATTPSGKGSVESDRKYRTSYEKELRNEVKLLKECGAIMNTPAELQRRSDRKENSPSGSTSSRQNKQLSASSADLCDSARSEERRRRETLGWYLDRGVDVDYQPRTPGDVFVSSKGLGFNGQSCTGCSPSAAESGGSCTDGQRVALRFPGSKPSASGAESRNGTGGSSGGKNVDRERPIIGMVAAHWNEQLLEAEVSPKKEWDGKGIPNSTNKYKEDQTVNFHATPFEERLEKALCDDRFYPTRGRLIDLDENEVLETSAS